MPEVPAGGETASLAEALDGVELATADELESLREFQRAADAERAEIERNTETTVRAKFKRQPVDENGHPLSVALELARARLREIKATRSERGRAAGPVCAAVLQRAVDAAAEELALLEDGERGRAERYGLRFEPSLTLQRVHFAVANLRDRLRHAERLPESTCAHPRETLRGLGLSF